VILLNGAVTAGCRSVDYIKRDGTCQTFCDHRAGTDIMMWVEVRVYQTQVLLVSVAACVIGVAVRSTIRKAGDPEYIKVFVRTREGQKIFRIQPEGPKLEPSSQEPSGDTLGDGEEPSPSHGEGKMQD